MLLSTRVRACRARCAPAWVQRIDCFFENRSETIWLDRALDKAGRDALAGLVLLAVVDDLPAIAPEMGRELGGPVAAEPKMHLSA